MRTTVLNPTIWLLAATAVAALVGSARRRDAQEVSRALLRWACAWPVLILVTALAIFGVGSRVVLGHLAPGAYAEEVVAARTFLATGQLYSADARSELAEWLSEPAGASVPWNDVPGVTPCQANALENRERFYTEHAHTPMLLLAGVPVVAIAGGKGLFVLLITLALASVAGLWIAAASVSGVALRSREGLLMLAALSAWQPVLAGIRQGDAALPAAALVAFAWHRGAVQRAPAALATAVAACLALPAVGAPIALLRQSARAGGLAVGAFVLAIGVTVAATGLQTLPDYLRVLYETTRTYAEAIPNYAIAGRLMKLLGSGGAATIGVLIVLVSWRSARSADIAFAVFAAAGLLLAPVLWSQHLSLAFIPGVLLLRTVLNGGSSAALGGWAALMLLLSLPDPAVIALSRIAGASVAAPVPVVPLALFALWLWVARMGWHARRVAPANAASTPIGVLP